jgi:hypothetical protein
MEQEQQHLERAKVAEKDKITLTESRYKKR